MKKICTIISALLLLSAFSSNAQIFWTENFESGSSGGALASAYTGPNGAWSVTSTGANDAFGNIWYVSCAENGHTAGVCGTGCAAVSSTATLATLHIGGPSALGGDGGAAYNAGGFSPFNGATNLRAESPTINCTGKVGITLSFNYIENGDGANDDATVWYYNGTSWSLLTNPAKTPLGSCSPQGQWTHFTFTLPSSADNNPNVKIGFNWTNNDDGMGTDPSFAVDSVSLSAPASTTPDAALTASVTTLCSDSCATFTNTSTGTAGIDSFNFKCEGVRFGANNTSPVQLCFATAGSYNVRVYLYDGGIAIDSATVAMTVKQSPRPVITKTGSTLSVPSAYASYQWYNGISPIAGATNASYTYSTPGIYGIMVDSMGCKGVAVKNTVGVQDVNASDNTFWIAYPPGSSLPLHAASPLDAALNVSVYDATGRTVATGIWQKGSTSFNVGELNAPAGIYIVKLSNETTNVSMRWLRE